MAKFSMTDILNDRSKKEGEKGEFKVKSIDVEAIIPDERNFYNTDEVEELKASIEMFGLQQNLVVKDIGDGKYSLISGHRRLKAIKSLIESGNDKLKLVPCKIEDEIDEVMSELQLIMANSTARELSDYEKTHQVVKIKELLTEIKKNGVKLPGRMRDIVADTLKVSPTQVARMESIDKNLSKEFKEEFKEEKVNISTAYELSSLPEEKQDEAYKEYKDKGEITIKDVKQIKETNNSEDLVMPEVEKIDKVDICKDESGVIDKEKPEVEQEEEKQLKVYVCSSEGKRFGIVEYIEKVVKLGHIPLNAQAVMWGVTGIQAEEALRALSVELISISDEVWVCGDVPGLNTAYTTMVEINVANKLNKKVVYVKGD